MVNIRCGRRSPSMAKTFYASIYCKIYTDTFSTDMVDRITTGDEVFAFLVRDSGNAFNPSGVRIPGDHNLWYLGCNEKRGHLVYNNHYISWGYGESSFDHVEEFVRLLFEEGHFNSKQFHIIMEILEEGRKIDCIYDIPRYLITKRRGRPWTKTPESENFRQRMKELSRHVIMAFEDSGYTLQPVA
jgi:hypothetical protein